MDGASTTETYAEQPITTHEDDEYMSYLSHYVVQGDQHIPVYQTIPVNAKARDMNNTNVRPPIQKQAIKVGKGKDKVIVQSGSYEDTATIATSETTGSLERKSSQNGKGEEG